MIYLDHNATTPVLPEVLDAMLPYLREHFGNPSSAHGAGAHGKRALEAARAQVAALLGGQPDEIVFTGSGTEASNLAIRGALADLDPHGARDGPHGAIVTTPIEHPATLAPVALLERAGWRVRKVPVDEHGRAGVSEAEQVLRTENVKLVSVMHANNETGVLQPVAQLARLAREARALVHVDAAQSFGKVPVDVRALDADLVTIAGHKLYAPKGVGALYVRRAVRARLKPVILGAGHEGGLRPGTENVAGIVALGAACVIAARDMDAEATRVRALRDDLFALLAYKVPGLALTGRGAERLPNTLHVRFPNVTGTALLARAPEVCASTGSACHDGVDRPSSVLTAMGLGHVDALGAVRLTLGRGTTRDDIVRAADLLTQAWTWLAG